MTDAPYIQVEEITQKFGSQEVLRGVSFEVRKGELLALIGGSGAGKSVILKHLVGLLDPVEGKVLIEGQEISNVPESEKAILRSKIGFMFQQGALFDSMTVFDNVAFPLVESGVKDSDEIERRVLAALEAVELAEHWGKMPANLSGGMIKRVAVARAIVSEPDCLFYDEPTAGLDPVVTDSVSFLIRKICVSKQITSIIVTHDMPSVIHIADRIIFLHQGRVYWTGTPKELLNTEDGMLRNFMNGHSGEDWRALGEASEFDFQQKLLQASYKERYQSEQK